MKATSKDPKDDAVKSRINVVCQSTSMLSKLSRQSTNANLIPPSFHNAIIEPNATLIKSRINALPHLFLNILSPTDGQHIVPSIDFADRMQNRRYLKRQHLFQIFTQSVSQQKVVTRNESRIADTDSISHHMLKFISKAC